MTDIYIKIKNFKMSNLINLYHFKHLAETIPFIKLKIKLYAKIS